MLRRERPDALVLTTFKKVFLAGMGARLAGVPRVVQRIVLSTDVPRGARYRLALRRFVDVIALNAGVMRPAFLAADPELDPTRVRTLYDGVRVPARSGEAGAVRRALGLPAGARTVGAVARLAKQKRFERLLGAVALLPADVHCVLAGEGGGEGCPGSARGGAGDRASACTSWASAATWATCWTRWTCTWSARTARGWRTRCWRRWPWASPW